MDGTEREAAQGDLLDPSGGEGASSVELGFAARFFDEGQSPRASKIGGRFFNKSSHGGVAVLRRKNSPQSPSIKDETKNKNHEHLTSNSQTPTNSGELPKVKTPRYCWGSTRILNSKFQPSEDVSDVCLTDPENPEEELLEFSRPDRVPPPE
jgi:hypothetical protein